MKRVQISAAGWDTPEKAHDALAKALEFPDYYGRNLDAMYDALTEYGGEWRIVFRNSANAPEMFRQVCMDAAADTPGLEIVFG